MNGRNQIGYQKQKKKTLNPVKMREKLYREHLCLGIDDTSLQMRSFNHNFCFQRREECPSSSSCSSFSSFPNLRPHSFHVPRRSLYQSNQGMFKKTKGKDDHQLDCQGSRELSIVGDVQIWILSLSFSFLLP